MATKPTGTTGKRPGGAKAAGAGASAPGAEAAKAGAAKPRAAKAGAAKAGAAKPRAARMASLKPEAGGGATMSAAPRMASVAGGRPAGKDNPQIIKIPLTKGAAVAEDATLAVDPQDNGMDNDKEQGPSLRKKELIERVVTESGVKKKDVKPVVDALLAILGKALAQGEAISLAPLGKGKVTSVKDLPNGTMLVIRLRQTDAVAPVAEGAGKGGAKAGGNSGGRGKGKGRNRGGDGAGDDGDD